MIKYSTTPSSSNLIRLEAVEAEIWQRFLHLGLIICYWFICQSSLALQPPWRRKSEILLSTVRFSLKRLSNAILLSVGTLLVWSDSDFISWLFYFFKWIKNCRIIFSPRLRNVLICAPWASTSVFVPILRMIHFKHFPIFIVKHLSNISNKLNFTLLFKEERKKLSIKLYHI